MAPTLKKTPVKKDKASTEKAGTKKKTPTKATPRAPAPKGGGTGGRKRKVKDEGDDDGYGPKPKKQTGKAAKTENTPTASKRLPPSGQNGSGFQPTPRKTIAGSPMAPVVNSSQQALPIPLASSLGMGVPQLLHRVPSLRQNRPQPPTPGQPHFSPHHATTPQRTPPLYGLQAQTPQRPQDQQQASAENTAAWMASTFHSILRQVLMRQPGLLPDTEGGVLTSKHMDNITSAAWVLALQIQGGRFLWHVTSNAGAMPESLLRVLARMNMLPSWWTFRQKIVLEILKIKGRYVDDAEVRAMFTLALHQVTGIDDGTKRKMLRWAFPDQYAADAAAPTQAPQQSSPGQNNSFV